MPITGWSTEHGDLRIAHFVGLHGLQVIPLIGWWLFYRAGRGDRRFNESQRVQIVWTSALAYTGIVLLVAWQALRGQSLVQPDALTIGTFVAIVIASTISFVSIGRHRAHRLPGAASA